MSVKQAAVPPVFTLLRDGKPVLHGPLAPTDRAAQALLQPDKPKPGFWATLHAVFGVWLYLVVALVIMLVLGAVAFTAGTQSIWIVLLLGLGGLGTLASRSPVRIAMRRKRRLRGLR